MYIKLSNNKSVLIDAKDLGLVNKYRWHWNKGYAVAREKGEFLTMHRVIMNTPKGLETDHINGNKLDNRRSNLRIVSDSQNAMNRRKYTILKSKFKGVCLSWWNKNKWQAYIKKDYKQIKLGYFDTEIEAAKAYNVKAMELFGEYAYLNSV